jgi:hypothetical protein
MSLYFCFDGSFDDNDGGGGEGAIPEPKFAFRTKAACERYLAIILALEGKDRDDEGGYARFEIGSGNVVGNPAVVYELLLDGDGCTVFMGLFANKAQAEAKASKLKRDEIKQFGEEMDTISTVSAVQVLDEFIE